MKSVLYHQAHFDQLKTSVLNTAGIKSIVTADCYRLSLKISTATNKRVSETTLKRVFGFTTSSYRPSNYTLNVLAEYSGSVNWDEFCTQFDEKMALSKKKCWDWARVRSAAMKISLFQLQGNQYKSGVPYELTLDRQRLNDCMTAFLESDATACIMDGVAGVGKTIAITRWVSQHIDASDQDIVLFTNSLSMQQHLLSGYDGTRWLADLLGLSSPTLLQNIMAKYENNAPGKFLLVVDETHRVLSSHPPNQQLLSELISLVSYFSQYPWFRVVLVVRSTTLKQYRKYFYNLITKPEWFSTLTQGNGSETERPIVAPFSDVELRTLLNRLTSSPEEGLVFMPRELDLIRMPLLFQHYYELEDGKIDMAKANEVSPYFILSRYIEATVDSISVGTDTQLLLDDLIPLTECSKRECCSQKKKAFPIIQKYTAAYQGLLSSGLFYEETRNVDGQPQTVICFQSEMVAGYFLALQVLAKIGKTDKVCDVEVDDGLRDVVTRWCLFLMARSGDMAGMDFLQKHWIVPDQREQYMVFAADAYGQLNQKNHKPPFETPVPDTLSRLVIHHFSLSERFHAAATKLLDFSLPTSDRIALHAAIALHGLLAWNEEHFMHHLKELVWLGDSNNASQPELNPHEAFAVVYQYLVGQPVSDKQLQSIQALIATARTTPKQTSPAFYIVLGLATHFVGDKGLRKQFVPLAQQRVESAINPTERAILQCLLPASALEEGTVETADSCLAISNVCHEFLVAFFQELLRQASGTEWEDVDMELLEWADRVGLRLLRRIHQGNSATSHP